MKKFVIVAWAFLSRHGNVYLFKGVKPISYQRKYIQKFREKPVLSSVTEIVIHSAFDFGLK